MADAAAISIVPHRAAYIFKLIDVEPARRIDDVTSGMTFESRGWGEADNCLRPQCFDET